MMETSDKTSVDIEPQQHISMSTKDEINERSNVTPQELAEIGADVYGLTTSFAASCRLTNDEEGLRALDAELARMPTECKSSFLQALRINPSLVDNEHRMLFLRCEDMDAQRAANRLTFYWQKRLELFGPDKCYYPLTLNGALRDDEAAWSQKFCQLLPCKDKFGRAILFIDPSTLNDKFECSPESLVRFIWYVHHIAISDPGVQQKGLVYVGFEKHTTTTSFFFGGSEKYYLQKKMPELLHALPAKTRVLHMCHPNLILFMLLPVLKFFLGRRERLRLIVHGGSDAKVLEDLAHYGMTPDVLPQHLGGIVRLNAEEWVQRRIVIETPAAASAENYPKEEGKPDSVATPVKKVSSNLADDVAEQAEEGSRSDGVATDYVNALAAKFPKAKRRAGRIGDPRMNKATMAKLADPNLSLLDALVEGGFVFSNLGDSNSDKGVFDDDGISLYQRKNQLNRRLRNAKSSNT